MTAFSHACFPGRDLVGPYTPFYDPRMAPLPEHVKEALLIGAQAAPLLPSLEEVSSLQDEGYLPLETGYALTEDGGAHIAVLTVMPGVTAAMWDWWFSWHGSSAERYRLWHPLAHVDVAWADGRDDLQHYIGRVSHVVEYVGSESYKAAIRFVQPSTLGFDELCLQSRRETAICARISMVIMGLPVETGWLVHHVRPINGGVEMRSRFYLGGRYVRLFGVQGIFGEMLGRLANRLQPIRHHQITELLVHDAHEMQHLAGILPGLYARFSST